MITEEKRNDVSCVFVSLRGYASDFGHRAAEYRAYADACNNVDASNTACERESPRAAVSRW